MSAIQFKIRQGQERGQTDSHSLVDFPGLLTC